MRIRWRTFWFLVGFLPLLIAIWLLWHLPGMGFFRLDMENSSLPQNGMVLVERKAGQPANSYPLISHAIGWHALREMWPLMLLCTLAGYQLGVVYPWLYRLLTGGQPLPSEVSAKEKELSDLAAGQSGTLWLQSLEIKDLRTQLQQIRTDLFDMKITCGEQRKNTVELERKAESVQRELNNARAKIRRLAAKR